MHAPTDALYRRVPFRASEFEHRYGARVHLLADPLCLMLLARFCRKGTLQPEINRLLVDLYRTLVHDVVATEFPRTQVEVETRMVDHTPRGVWRGEALDP